MVAERLPNGNLLVPKRAEGPNGIIGDGMVEIGPDDPEFVEWDSITPVPRRSFRVPVNDLPLDEETEGPEEAGPRRWTVPR